MAKQRITYDCQALLVGPSPSSGFHFLDYGGTLNNNYDNLASNHNLLKQINRVQSVGFSLETNRTEIRQLGTKSLVARPVINAPTIELSFEYLLNGVANDARLGLNVNYSQYYLSVSGAPFYNDNYQVDLLSGLCSRSFNRLITGDPYHPLEMRDNRNIFLVRSANEGTELQRLGQYRFDVPDTTQGIDPLAPTYEVLGFGQCYLNSYESFGAVGAFPASKVSFACENVVFYTSGSGCNIPAIDTRTRELINQNKFNIPEIRNEGGPYILNPGDIQLSITPTGWSSINGIGVDFNTSTVTNYSFSMDFNRDLLQSIGHKCPIDREITFPVICNLNFDVVLGDLNSGAFIEVLNRDSGYNIDLKLRGPLANAPFPTIQEPTKDFGGYSTAGLGGIEGSYTSTGIPTFATKYRNLGQTFIHYAFRKALLENVSFSNSIGGNSTATVNFSVELNPERLGEMGFYISGDLGLDNPFEEYLIDQSGFYVIDEIMNPIVTNLKPAY